MSTTYCSIDDLKRIVPEAIIEQLIDDANTGGDITSFTTDLESIINDAEDRIDSVLRTRYSVPLSSVPADVKRICMSIARYYLYDRRGINIPQSVTDAFTDAKERLDLIRTGELDLGIESQTTSSLFKVNKTADDRYFGNTDDIDSGNDVKYNLDNFDF